MVYENYTTKLGKHISLFFTFKGERIQGRKSRAEFFNWQSALQRVADQIECLLSAWGGSPPLLWFTDDGLKEAML